MLKIPKPFIIKTKVWRWPGDSGWHFITLDKKLFEKIRKAYPKGFVKVEAKLDKTTWPTSLFPHKKSGSYLLCISKKVRHIENVLEGDEITVRIKIL